MQELIVTGTRRGPFLRRATTGRLSRGQSLVEFALVIPLILVVLLVGIDFGRVYLGYINVQNMARIAANYAANNPTTAWGNASDPDVETYLNLIVNDARATNCTLPQSGGNPDVSQFLPTYSDGPDSNMTTTDVGDLATVEIPCTFRIVTPIISGIVGSNGDLPVSASAVFPVKAGRIATGGGTAAGPVAAFTGTPQSGPAPLVVQFTDTSTGDPTEFAWDFDGDGGIDSSEKNPSHTYGSPGQYSVTLVVTNAVGTDTVTRTNYLTVGMPLDGVSFTAIPGTGSSPLTVQFTDTSTNSPTTWAWDFDNDGTTDSTEQNPVYTYTVPGTYSVKLTVEDASGQLSTLIANLITVSAGLCVVPDFYGVASTDAQALWESRGFTTDVEFQQGNLPWTIQGQNQTVAQEIPCSSPVTVSKN